MSSIYEDASRVALAVKEGRHREVVGGLWEEIGLLQFNFLVQQGLKPDHTLLDIGCGALRGGIHFVRYLKPGRYVGVDRNQPLLDAGFDIELARAELQQRVSRSDLVCIDDFDFSKLGRVFDYALAQSVFTHLAFNQIRDCMERLAPAMAAGGVLFATFFEILETELASVAKTHTPGGIVTHSSSDPFHYRVSDFRHAIRGLPWQLQWHGEWNHPRAQQMLMFVRSDAPRP